MVSACKTGSAKKVTAVLPLFPYSRQPDLPYNKTGAPLNKPGSDSGKYTFESVPATPGPGLPKSIGLNSGIDITKMLTKASLANGNGVPRVNGETANSSPGGSRNHAGSVSSVTGNYTTHDYENPQMINAFQAKPGYKQWVAQAGTLVADLLTCAGADHVCAPSSSSCGWREGGGTGKRFAQREGFLRVHWRSVVACTNFLFLPGHHNGSARPSVCIFYYARQFLVQRFSWRVRWLCIEASSV